MIGPPAVLAARPFGGFFASRARWAPPRCLYHRCPQRYRPARCASGAAVWFSSHRVRAGRRRVAYTIAARSMIGPPAVLAARPFGFLRIACALGAAALLIPSLPAA